MLTNLVIVLYFPREALIAFIDLISFCCQRRTHKNTENRVGFDLWFYFGCLRCLTGFIYQISHTMQHDEKMEGVVCFLRVRRCNWNRAELTKIESGGVHPPSLALLVCARTKNGSRRMQLWAQPTWLHATQCLPFYGNCQEALLSGDHSLKRVHESRAVYLAVCAIKPLLVARNGKWKSFFVARRQSKFLLFTFTFAFVCASNTHSLRSLARSPSLSFVAEREREQHIMTCIINSHTHTA